ncbi:MAG: diguanylate cyclase [Gammaproteobacteria bacterium]|nr:diguanylate cyclase [Gammaproteobacteria bacterium]MBU2059308.1 diguanylate cyclase [Gammaproteobacteria bacterium]MBU2175312.1 diguanylate cyclase [Gammaproteobacteria bacterium]MBU2247520.1 diguanylate cyclase [Gammaproteobacteria bacterium]MBU2342720.1 diguanylate cyclase [Gammaproteobacteria bacterium]
MSEKETSSVNPGLLSLDQHFRKAISVFALYPFVLLMLFTVVVVILSSVYRSHVLSQSMLQQLRTSIVDVASREASLINQQLTTVSDLVRIARPEHEYYLALPRTSQLPLQGAEPVFTIAENGAFYKSQDNGGSSVYFPPGREIEQEQLWKARNTERLDGLYKAIVNASDIIDQAYFNSWDNMTRVYPFIDKIHTVLSQSPVVTTSNFYYLADATHNPARDLVWTSAYHDPFGMGWMVSAIIPVYKSDFLTGVFGVDITLSTLTHTMLDRAYLTGRNVLLLDKNSQIIAVSDEIAPMLKMPASASDKGPEAEAVGSSSLLNQLMEWVNTEQSLLEITISGQDFLLSKTEIAETQWQLVVLQEISDVMSPIQRLERTEMAVSLAGLLLLLTLGSLYFRFVYQRAKIFARHFAAPIQQLTLWTSSLGEAVPANKSNIVKSKVAEIATLVENFRTMFTELHDRNEKLIAAHISNQLSEEKARLYQQMANTDQLTQLHNRKYLDTALRQYSDSVQPALCIMLIDIDHFKQVNDLYGHQVGDFVLKKVADCLKYKSRTKDIVGRWGGEEFLIICQDSSLTQAGILADSLRVEIEQLDLIANHKVTISVGIAQMRNEERAEQTIARADTMLYRSKHNGRNQVSLELAS